MQRLLRWWLLMVVGLSPWGTLHAETKIGFRQLGAIYPVAVQRGTTTEVKIHSNYTLDEAYAVFFDRPGIRMTFKETKPIAAPRRGRGQLGTPFRFECTVPADQPTGVYEVRVATRQAVSSVTHLYVSEYPIFDEQAHKANDSLEAAVPVPIPVCIAGVCERLEDVDYFRFSGQEGQELTIEIFAQRVTEAIHSMQTAGVYLMDSLLTLYGPGGRVIAQNDNFFRGDSFLHVRLPETGDYVLEVRDARFIGDRKYVYCVEISDRPYAHALFPMAVQRGTEAEVTIVGHMLGETPRTTLKFAPDEKTGWRRMRVSTSRGPTNPVDVCVSEYPQVLAGGENLTLEKAQTITPPVGVNGRFTEPDQTHYYAFEAKKGQVFLLEVESHRHGLPLDSVLTVTDAKGKKLAESDDLQFTKDARLFFTAPADGRYVVALRDLHDRGGERFVYHLRVEPSGPDFEVQGEYYYAQIAPGTNMIWFARINRLNGFNGPVEMHVDGLPQGVSLVPVTIPSGMNHCALILTAAEDAPIGASAVQVYGTAQIPGPDGTMREVKRVGRITCELQASGGGQARWPIHTSIVGVTKPLDLLKVEAEPAELVLKPGEKAEIKVRIVRNEGFTDPVTLAMSFLYFTTSYGEQLPPGVKLAKGSTTRLAGKTLEGKIVLEAANNALPVERLPIAVMARVPITFSITTNYASNPIYLTVPAAPGK